MKKFVLICMALFFVFVSSFSHAVNIRKPEGGFVRNKIFNLQVEDAPYLMKINFNGISVVAKTEGGFFEREMLVSKGYNYIVVSDYQNLSILDQISFYADVPPTSLKIFLFWDTDNTDLDLHVIEPDGNECYYEFSSTPLGGRLDVDVMTGYGPEIYTMEYPNQGVYEIFVDYYGGQELTEATVVAIINEGTSNEKRMVFNMMLTKPKDKVYIGKIEVK